MSKMFRPPISDGTINRLEKLVPVRLGEGFDRWLNRTLDVVENEKKRRFG